MKKIILFGTIFLVLALMAGSAVASEVAYLTLKVDGSSSQAVITPGGYVVETSVNPDGSINVQMPEGTEYNADCGIMDLPPEEALPETTVNPDGSVDVAMPEGTEFDAEAPSEVEKEEDACGGKRCTLYCPYGSVAGSCGCQCLSAPAPEEKVAVPIQDQLTITTYYPAPYGEYCQLRIDSLLGIAPEREVSVPPEVAVETEPVTMPAETISEPSSSNVEIKDIIPEEETKAEEKAEEELSVTPDFPAESFFDVFAEVDIDFGKADINSDGIIDDADVLRLESALNSLADINKDGILDNQDIQCLSEICPNVDSSEDRAGNICTWDEVYILPEDVCPSVPVLKQADLNQDGVLDHRDIETLKRVIEQEPLPVEPVPGPAEPAPVPTEIVSMQLVGKSQFGEISLTTGKADINRDGIIDDTDAKLLESFFDVFVDVSLSKADLNQDGNIDYADVESLRSTLVRGLPPSRPEGQEIIPTEIVSMELIGEYCRAEETPVTPPQTTQADINRDGVVDERDTELLRAMLDGILIYPNEFDINMDGVLDQYDLEALKEAEAAANFPAESFFDVFVEVELKKADLNQDGIIDQTESFFDVFIDVDLSRADMNKDGMVDTTDTEILRSTFNQNLLSHTTLPETIDTEIISLELTGSSSTGVFGKLFLDLTKADLNQDGIIGEVDTKYLRSAFDNTFPAESFFDVFVEVDINFMKADINKDGVIDLVDTELLESVLGRLVDINGDGLIDDQDTQSLSEICPEAITPAEDKIYLSPGLDFFKVDEAFFNVPIPADFFGPGSEPFTAKIDCKGDSGSTVIERLTYMDFGSDSTNTVEIELVALSLKSCEPITVPIDTPTEGGDFPAESFFNMFVEVDLSSVIPSTGKLTAVKTHENGGTFTSEFVVQPRFTFTKVSDGTEVELDTGEEELSFKFYLEEMPWSFCPGTESQFCPSIINGEQDKIILKADNGGMTLSPFPDGDWLVGGDLNDDPYVDIVDFGIFVQCWSISFAGKSEDKCQAYDFDDDGDIDLADFSSFQLTIYDNCPTPVFVPELPVVGCEVLDCNGNSISDEQDITDDPSKDCNQNGIPDECDIESGTSQDCKPNWIPDECESDSDLDSIPDGCDSCPATPNSDQSDRDLDGFGDVCDACPNDPENDVENDGVCGDVDNCPVDPNPPLDCDDDPLTPDEQCDFDKDGIGDVCDADADGDNVEDEVDSCIFFDSTGERVLYSYGYTEGEVTSLGIFYYSYNPDQSDIDGDGIGDVCDPCPADATDTCDPTQSAAATIGAEGGTLTNEAGTVKLDVPTGLLGVDTSVSITGLSDLTTQSPFGNLVSPVYDFGPSGSFSEPVTVTFYYDPADPLIGDSSTLDIFYHDESLDTWTPMEATLDEANNALILEVDHFSRYALGIRDVTPPEISLAVSPDELWPANHEMTEIVAELIVVDDYDPNPVVELEITSNEPDDVRGNGDGDTVDDIQIIDGVISLRAERAGNGEGRTYTITYTAADISSNSASQSVEVFVPHDREKGSKKNYNE